MKNVLIVFIVLIISISYAVTLDDLLKYVNNSPELLYDKLIDLQPINKNLTFDISKNSTQLSFTLSYPLTKDFYLSAYAINDSNLHFGFGAHYTFDSRSYKKNKSFWYKSVQIKIKIINLYFDAITNPENADYDKDMIKYLSSIPLNKTINLEKPSFTVLNEDQKDLFKKFYNSVKYSPFESSFGGYNLGFKFIFENPISYEISFNIPIHFDYDQLINDQYSKIILEKTTIIFRQAYRNYYKYLSELVKEKAVIKKLNDDYIKIYNENIKGMVSYSEVLEQKKLIDQETKKIDDLSLGLTKYAYEILVLSGEK
jgi:hypothetical protein